MRIGKTDRGKSRRSTRRRRKDWCDWDCDGCDGCAACDFGLFSGALLFASAGAGLLSRAGSAGGRTAADRVGLAAIRGYRRWLSHRLPTRCRFTPTCSAYGLVAVERYGLAVGGRMAADRVRRCRAEVPLGTFDPVP